MVAMRACAYLRVRGQRPALFQRNSLRISAAQHGLLLPMYHIFGSDELSLSAPGIAELTAKPHVQLTVKSITENQEVE